MVRFDVDDHGIVFTHVWRLRTYCGSLRAGPLTMLSPAGMTAYLNAAGTVVIKDADYFVLLINDTKILPRYVILMTHKK